MTITTGIYRHYKGPRYMVLGVVRHSETEERMVLYVGLEPHSTSHGSLSPMLCVRPVHGPDGFFTPTEGGLERFALEVPINFCSDVRAVL